MGPKMVAGTRIQAPKIPAVNDTHNQAPARIFAGAFFMPGVGRNHRSDRHAETNGMFSEGRAECVFKP